MSTNAVSGIGTKFQRWSAAAWHNIAEVNTIAGPGMSRETIDCTSLDSTDGYREKIGGLRDGGTVVLNMNFTRSGYDDFKDDFESSTLGNYRIHMPDDDNTSVEFEGWVNELPLDISPDDRITMNVTIEITGPVETDSGESAGLGM